MMFNRRRAAECRSTTVEGQPLIVSEEGGDLMVTDQKGDIAEVTIPDVYQSNGVIMVLNKVLMP